jgi:hypothetical protein
LGEVHIATDEDMVADDGQLSFATVKEVGKTDVVDEKGDKQYHRWVELMFGERRFAVGSRKQMACYIAEASVPHC